MRPLAGVLALGAAFGAATSLTNALARRTVDLESRAATTGGWSVTEIVSLLLDSGWSWAGLAVLAGWLATRAGRKGPALASVLFGPVLGAVGACAGQSGAIGVLARVTVPVGAAVQMIVLPPGRNAVITTIGQWVVWAAAVVSVGVVVVHFLKVRSRRVAPMMEGQPTLARPCRQ